jgi:hypothetical protein
MTLGSVRQRKGERERERRRRRRRRREVGVGRVLWLPVWEYVDDVDGSWFQRRR